MSDWEKRLRKKLWKPKKFDLYRQSYQKSSQGEKDWHILVQPETCGNEYEHVVRLEDIQRDSFKACMTCTFVCMCVCVGCGYMCIYCVLTKTTFVCCVWRMFSTRHVRRCNVKDAQIQLLGISMWLLCNLRYSVTLFYISHCLIMATWECCGWISAWTCICGICNVEAKPHQEL